MRVSHIVVIGASAGGIETLRELVGRLPAGFSAPICVVLHTSPQSPGVLPDILNRAGALEAVNGSTGMRLKPGHIYVAPPDRHLVVEPGTIRVAKGPRENRFRPAIDPLFRSAAQVYGPRTIGVILSGNLDDGAAGLWTVKQLGGVAIVQDPEDALFPSMPQNAIQHVSVDYVVPLAEIAALLVRLTAIPVETPPAVAVSSALEVEVTIGRPSSYACPECHGVLLQLEEGNRVRFRCHTGHAYSVASLIAAVDDGIEDSLWNAVRALEEGGLLMRRMGEHLKASHDGVEADRLIACGDAARRHSDELRRLIAGREPAPAAATS